MKTKATALVPQPGPIRKLIRKKAKKKFKKSKVLGGSGTPGSRPTTVASRPTTVASRPPKAPENFSQNWKALQELLKQKSQAPEKPLIPQLDDKIHPQIIQKNRKKTSDKSRGDKRTEDKTTRDSVTSAPKKDRKILVSPTNTSGTEQKKGAEKRAFSDLSSHQGDIKLRRQLSSCASPRPLRKTSVLMMWIQMILRLL